jgi:regulator of sirC expression with transglutaminase-like and TPR domain
MHSIKNEFLSYLEKNDFLKAALVLGKVQDIQLKKEKYVEQILALASRVWQKSTACRNDLSQMIEIINQVLFKEFELVGRNERYKQIIDDPKRYLLHSVLTYRTGCPLTITILYRLVCEQLGLETDCIALPSYYILRIRNNEESFYVDPFDSGVFLSEDEVQRKVRSSIQKSRMAQNSLYEELSFSQLLGRLVHQLKHIFILKGGALEALRAVEILTALFPDSPELTRDRGILYCEIEYFSKAIDDLKKYLKQRPNADDVSEIKKLATMIKGYREIMN